MFIYEATYNNTLHRPSSNMIDNNNRYNGVATGVATGVLSHESKSCAELKTFNII